MDDPVKEKPKMTLKKFFIILSVVSLIFSGFLAAFTIISGMGDSWQAALTSFVVFAANILVLASLNATHFWLKLSQWIAISIAVIMQFIVIWVRPIFPEIYCSSGINCQVDSWEIFTSFVYSFWVIVVVLSLLSFISKTWLYIKESIGLKLLYISVYVLSIAGSIIMMIGLIIESINYFSDYRNEYIYIASALWILAVTFTIIIIIFSQLAKARARTIEKERKQLQQQKLLENYELLKQSRFKDNSNNAGVEVDFESEAFKAALRFEVHRYFEDFLGSEEFKEYIEKFWKDRN